MGVLRSDHVDSIDNLHLTLGARYTDDTKDMHRELTLTIWWDRHAISTSIRNWNETTGTGIINYDFTENVDGVPERVEGLQSRRLQRG